VAAVKLGSNSSTIWNISPPDKERLLHDLKGNKTLTSRFRYKVSRVSHSKENPGIVEEERSYEFKGNDSVGLQLIKLLENPETATQDAVMPFMMPKYLKVKNAGTLRPAHQLLRKTETDDDASNFRNLSLKLYETRIGDTVPTQFWWEARELCSEDYFKNVADDFLYANCKSHVTMYLFNDKIFPSTISSIAGGG